ncbi:exported hypothetical protein [Vibrio nigripulchritudo FTn2]|uniref:hypothetical protein n=1 Tax=Vibrio nigripulchritudo TaxID=28173 RepID=UPI0003B22ADC|nr:hypothetical protein [Vibrio nigripulchritudo]CCN40231.1 exported hypothetical protein [Vibrio nigripulchritudo FTn2]
MFRLLCFFLIAISARGHAEELLRAQHTLLPFPTTITLFTSVDEPASLMVKKPRSESFEFVTTVSPLSKYQYYEPSRSGNYYFRLVREGKTLGKVRVRSVSKPTANFDLPDELFTHATYPIRLNTNCKQCKVSVHIEYMNQEVFRTDQKQFQFQPKNEGVYQLYAVVLVTDPETGLDSLLLSAEKRVSFNVRKPYSISAFINFPKNAKAGDILNLSLIVPGLTKNKECFMKVDGKPLYGCSTQLDTSDWAERYRLYLEAQVTSKHSYHIPTTSHLDLQDPMIDQDTINIEYLGDNKYLIDTVLGDRLELETNDDAAKYTKLGPAILLERNLFRHYIFRSFKNDVQLSKSGIYEKSSKDLDINLTVNSDKNSFIAPFTIELNIDVSKFNKNNIRSVELFHNDKPLLVRRSRIAYQISEVGNHVFDLVLTTKQGIKFKDSEEVFVEGNVKPTCEIQSNLEDGYFNARCQDTDGFIQSVEWFVNGHSVSNRRKLSIPSSRYGAAPIIRFEVIDNLNAIRNYIYDHEKSKWAKEK